jgi:hypothetical protein
MYIWYIFGLYLTYLWAQDCVANIPPYPHYIGDWADYDVASNISDPVSMWIVRPQPFFTCNMRPLNTTRGCYNRYSEVKSLDLVFFSAFEDLRLQTLAQWSQMELGSCMNPPLSPLCMLAM